MAKSRPRLMRLANAEAIRLGQDVVCPEHLLIALAGEALTPASRALAARGVNRQALRAVVRSKSQSADARRSDTLPQSPEAKQAIEAAIREARALGHNYVDPAHILLGLLRDGDGAARKMLQALGVDAAAIRALVLEQIGVA